MVSYDPRGMSWEQYNALMTELFAVNQLGTVPEDRWHDWARAMVNFGNFSKDGIPNPDAYKDWQDWAKSLCGVLVLKR